MSLLILVGAVLVLEFILRRDPAGLPRNVAPPVPDSGSSEVMASQLLRVSQVLGAYGRGPAPRVVPADPVLDGLGRPPDSSFKSR
jgi:hypothetical protein